MRSLASTQSLYSRLLSKSSPIRGYTKFSSIPFFPPNFSSTRLNRYESNENIAITCSTKVCSFGKQVVEKVETEYPRMENSRFIYRIQRSPMCEYMINFIQKLKGLPERYMMNSVLENFTILQVGGQVMHFLFSMDFFEFYLRE